MGTLGEYLRKAREAKDIDIRDAAQQTRISINYLKALEEEDFAKLPGDVFVKGFLKNYGKFLDLDESETLRRFGELKPKAAAPTAAPAAAAETAAPAPEGALRGKTSIEPYLWGGAICISLLVFLFISMPAPETGTTRQPDDLASSQLSSASTDTAQEQVVAVGSGKLYLELVAMEDTWLLIRTDTSPQKKAVLKKGESLIWSADERFLLSYGGVSAMKLFLNGEELTVRGTGETPVRDLAVTRSGIRNQPVPVKQPVPARSRPKAQVRARQAAPALAAPKQAVPVPASQTVPLPAASSSPPPSSAPAPAPEPEPAIAPAAAPLSAAAPASPPASADAEVAPGH